MIQRRAAINYLTLIFIIAVCGCVTPERTAVLTTAMPPVDTGNLQYILNSIFPIYPGAVVKSADNCPSGSMMCSAQLEVDASKSDVMSFYKIVGRQKRWEFDMEKRAKSETASLDNLDLWGLMNFTDKTGRFKSLTILIPPDAHTGTTRTIFGVKLMNPPDKINIGAPSSIPPGRKIDVGKSAQNSEWQIKVEYVKYEGTKVEVKDSSWMKPAVIGDAPAGFQLVRVRVGIERLDGKPIKTEFLKQAISVNAGGKSYGPIGGRSENGEFYNYEKGGSQNILVPVIAKGKVDYVFSIPADAIVSAFVWPNMPSVAIASRNSAAPSSPPEAQNAAARAAEFLKNDKYSDAAQEATRALDIDPNNIIALKTRAESHRLLKQHEKAVSDANRLLAIQPEHAYTLRTRAASLYYLNRFDEAIRDATLSLKIEPGHAFALKYRAGSYLMKKSYDQAIQDTTKALEIRSNDAFSYKIRAASLYYLNRFDEAIRDATEALRIEPSSVFTLKYRADAFRMKGQYNSAIRDADSVLASQPDNAFVLRTRAESLRMIGDCENAVLNAKRSLEIDPGNEFAKYTLAECAKFPLTVYAEDSPSDKKSEIEIISRLLGKNGEPLPGVELMIFKVKNKNSVVQQVSGGRVVGPNGKSNDKGELIILIPKDFVKTGEDFTFGTENSWLTKNGSPVLFTWPDKIEKNRLLLGDVYIEQ